MRIDQLTIQNFKGFAEQTFDFPQTVLEDGAAPANGSFHVLIGDNGSGKSSALDALAVAMGIWHVARPTAGWRAIKPEEARLEARQEGDTVRFEPMPSPTITARGVIDGRHVCWTRQNRGMSPKTSNSDAKDALKAVEQLLTRARSSKESVSLPILAYYGAGRAWLAGRERKESFQLAMKKVSRYDAYYYCLDGQIRHKEINRWFLFESVESFQRGKKRSGMQAVESVMLSCIPGATSIKFDADRKEIVLVIEGKPVPFYSLSDGQRSMLSMVGDIAIKCVLLNPHLGVDSVSMSPGIVLIDELDLHLHPNWQRVVVENLRRAFPQVQFVTTTHSPFVVQTLREGELISLDAKTVPQVNNLGVESIAKGLMGVDRPEVSPRYHQMKAVAKDYLKTLEEAAKSPHAKLVEYEERLAAGVAPYADNPAFQAFLEMKREAALGARENGNGRNTTRST